MLRAKEFEQFNKALVVARVEIWFVFSDIKPSEGQLVNYFSDKTSGNFLIEKIRLLGGQLASTKFLKTFDKFFVGIEKTFELLSIENKKLIDISNNKLFELIVLLRMAFAKVIKNQFLKGFSIEVLSSNHL